MAWIFKQQGSDNWWIGYRLNGRQYRHSTGSPDRAVADRELHKVTSIHEAHKAGSVSEEFFRVLTRKETAKNSLQGYMQQWLSECKDLSAVTVERYKDVAEGFCGYLHTDDHSPLLRDVQPEAIAGFLRQRRAETSAATAKLTRRILCAFFNYAVDNRALQINPVPSARSLKLNTDKKSIRRAFTLKELRTVYDKAPSDFWRYMILAGFYCGQRMGDLICLPWGAVDFSAKVIRMTASKTGKALQIPLRAELGTFLAELRRKTGNVKPADPIWPEQAARYAERGAGVFSNEFYDDVLLPAGLVPPRTHHAKQREDGARRTRQVNAISFHCLRHSFVTYLKITGGSQAVAKELAGHSSDQVSDLYTHNPPEILAKAIKRLPGVLRN